MRRALMTVAFLSPVLLPAAALAGPETWQGALDACLAPIERVEDAVECQAVFVEVCVNEAAEMGEAAPDVFCLAEEAKAWESLMTASLDMATERAKGIPGAAEALVNSQAAWVAYRDAECALAGALAAAEGLTPQATAACMGREALQRYISVDIVAQGGF